MSDVPSNNRAAFYIDGSNFFKYCEQLQIYAYQLEWDSLLQDVATGREIVAARYYDCPKTDGATPEEKRKQQQFFSLLRRIPWLELKLGRLARRKKGLVEKGVDVMIAVDLVLGAVNDVYDVAYLLSADADFVPAIEAAQSLGKRVFVATPGDSYHLGKVADVFIRIDSLRLNSHLRRHGGP
ncbi:MAG: NYN domain-containing protein [Myxococcales bacterium]|nr:NYN domain-containing protein [Myxococcales bacterium]